ncbi:MAG: 3-deoxy-manno-octulosonate cytidylyltransferase [Saccharospirillum sp.]
MTTVIMIPARYGSSRLPGKPLLDLGGQPMILRVAEVAGRAGLARVVVATDDTRIFDVVRHAGLAVVMTSAGHVSGTDRLQEAAEQLQLAADDIVINLQGDEPLMPAANLVQVAQLLETNPEAAVATLYEPITDTEVVQNPNAVKLVQDDNGRVLYFSRAPIPWDRDGDCQGEPNLWKRHIGLYAYRKRALDAFISWPEGSLERVERLEQLRFMQHGERIVAAAAAQPVPAGVDTESDLVAVRRHFEGEGNV